MRLTNNDLKKNVALEKQQISFLQKSKKRKKRKINSNSKLPDLSFFYRNRKRFAFIINQSIIQRAFNGKKNGDSRT